MMAAGAFMAPRRKLFPRLAMDVLAQEVTELVEHGNHGGHADGERQVVTGRLVEGPARKRGMSEVVERDRLLCFPDDVK
jgi:hypothetical protein